MRPRVLHLRGPALVVVSLVASVALFVALLLLHSVGVPLLGLAAVAAVVIAIVGLLLLIS
jgi:hypothetical protein